MPAADRWAEDADPMTLDSHTEAALLGTLPHRRFGVIGDSLSRGTGDPTPGYRPLGWSDRLARGLTEAHPDTRYLNVAVVGATTRQVIDTQLDAMANFGPDLLHLPSGANDIFARTADFDSIERDLRELYARVAGHRAQLITFTFGRGFRVPRIADWSARITRMNELVRLIAGEHAAIVVDMWDHPVNDRADLVSTDGIHFTTAGQAVLATEVLKALSRCPDASAG